MSDLVVCPQCKGKFKTKKTLDTHQRFEHKHLEKHPQQPVVKNLSSKIGNKRVSWRYSDDIKEESNSKLKYKSTPHRCKSISYSADRSNYSPLDNESRDTESTFKSSPQSQTKSSTVTPRTKTKSCQPSPKIEEPKQSPSAATCRDQRQASADKRCKEEFKTPNKTLFQKAQGQNQVKVERQSSEKADIELGKRKNETKIESQQGIAVKQQQHSDRKYNAFTNNLRQQGFKEETINLIKSKEHAQKIKVQMTNELIQAQSYDRELQIIELFYNFLWINFLKLKCRSYEDVFKDYQHYCDQTGKFLSPGQFNINIEKLNNYAGEEIIKVFDSISAKEKIRSIKATASMGLARTKIIIAQNIRQKFNDSFNAKASAGTIVKVRPFNRDDFDKTILVRQEVKRSVADHLKQICSTITSSLNYHTSDDESDMSHGDWQELAGFLPNTLYGALSPNDQTHVKSQFLELKRQKKRERKHHEKVQQLVKCFNEFV